MRLQILFLFSIVFQFTIAQDSFEVTERDNDDQVITRGIQGEDGHYYFVGKIGTNPADNDAYILKVDAVGEVTTKRITDTATNAYFSEISILDSETFLLIGQIAQTNSMSYNKMWFATMNTDLEIMDEKEFALPTDYYHSITFYFTAKNEDGSLIIAGTMRDSIHNDLCTVTINQTLDTIGTKFYVFPFEQQPDDWFRIQNTDEFMMISGHIGLYSTSVQTLRFDAQLNILSIHNMPRLLLGPGSVGQCYANNKLLLASTLSDSTDKGDDYNVAVLKIDTAGQVYDQKYFGKVDTTEYTAHLRSVAYINDTTVYVGGCTVVFGAWYDPVPTYFELYLIDTSLNLLGYNQFGGDANYRMWGVFPTSDDGCVMFGTRYGEENGPNERDIYIKKVVRDEISIITNITHVPDPPLIREAYPNPVSEIIHIPVKETTKPAILQLQIFDNSGRKIFEKQYAGSGNQLEVNVTTLKPGIYFYAVSNGLDFKTNGKFIKQ